MESELLGKKHGLEEGLHIGLQKHFEMSSKLSDKQNNDLISFLISNDIKLTSDHNTLDFICASSDDMSFLNKKQIDIKGFDESYVSKLNILSKGLAEQHKIKLKEKHDKQLETISERHKSDGSLGDMFFGGTILKAKNEEIKDEEKYYKSKKEHLKEGIFNGFKKHTQVFSTLSNIKTEKLLDYLIENNFILSIESDTRNFNVRQNLILSPSKKVLYHEGLSEKETYHNIIHLNRHYS